MNVQIEDITALYFPEGVTDVTFPEDVTEVTEKKDKSDRLTAVEAKNQFAKFQPYPFREHQLETIDFISDCDKKFVVVEAPTGSGKTLLGMVSGAMQKNLTYMVHSKVLQNQVTADFPEARSLFGRANYLCVNDPTGNRSCSECTHTEKSPCLVRSRCIYNLEKKACLASDYRILNYDYFLTEANYVGQFSGVPFLVIDEADNLENSFINFVSLTFTQFAMDRLGLGGPARKTADSKLGIEPWKEFVRLAQSKVLTLLEEMNRTINGWRHIQHESQVQTLKTRNRIASVLRKMGIFLDHVDHTWVYDDSQEGKYIFRPLWLNEDLAHEFLWQHADKIVLMSATFLPPAILAKTLGMPTEDIAFTRIPSTFPIERRPIRINPIANLTAKTMEEETPKLLKEIRNILDQHEHEKGLIHCVSYSLGQKIMKLVKNKRLLIHDNSNRQDVVDKFMQSKDPLVLISPSLERGLSLENDLCRFVIVAKAPFLYLGDKITSRRVYSGKTGQLWFTANMLLTVVQMSGRGMRSKDDYCVTYILDEQFKKALLTNPTIIPDWWKDGIFFN